MMQCILQVAVHQQDRISNNDNVSCITFRIQTWYTFCLVECLHAGQHCQQIHFGLETAKFCWWDISCFQLKFTDSAEIDGRV